MSILKLLLPILFPSWRFFSSIGPSPRIDIAWLGEISAEPVEWLPFRPLPERVGIAAGLQRLFYNPRWNERLYLNTCAEQLLESDSEFHAQQIAERLSRAVSNGELIAGGAQYLVFRVRALTSQAGQVSDELVFMSEPLLIEKGAEK